MRNFDAVPAPAEAAAVSDEASSMPRIWAIGGGKGGVGKSVVASNLAITLAAGGARSVVIDADLGGSNAHTLLGVPRPPHTLTQFLSGRAKHLEDVMCPTTVPDVWLISGARALLEAANLNYSKKQKIIRHIRKLEVGHVVLDLGAGSAFNVLDFFLAADRRILVVSPEPTAVENAYHFLKAAFFRSLRQVARQSAVRAVLEGVLAEARGTAATPRELIERAKALDPRAGALLRDRSDAFAPMLIVNQVQRPEQRRVGAEMSAACRVHLGSELRYLGALERDERVPEAVRRQLPVVQLYPGCAFSTGLRAIVERLRDDRAPDIELGRSERISHDAAPPLAAHGLANEREPLRIQPLAGQFPPEALPPLDTSQPGHYLRRCRKTLGLSISMISERTRIRRLDRIENERFDELPPEPYVRGYVLQYARALGIGDADALANSYIDRYRRAAAAGAAAELRPIA
jgi:flagellar biosynthesis protein FlhG